MIVDRSSAQYRRVTTKPRLTLCCITALGSIPEYVSFTALSSGSTLGRRQGLLVNSASLFRYQSRAQKTQYLATGNGELPCNCSSTASYAPTWLSCGARAGISWLGDAVGKLSIPEKSGSQQETDEGLQSQLRNRFFACIAFIFLRFGARRSHGLNLRSAAAMREDAHRPKPCSDEQQTSNNRLRRALSIAISRTLVLCSAACAFTFPRIARSSGGVIGAVSSAGESSLSPVQRGLVWFSLFALSAVMHSAESAITKISPWKVQEFAEEEGPSSPFATLSTNMTRLLITILLTTTACSIYSTALFVATLTDAFPQLSLGFITALLTVITLFFGELLPKALAVSNSELVARKFVPVLSRLATLLLPVTAVITLLSNLVLRALGLKSSVDDKDVSNDMLRMVVEEAQRTESIKSGEGRMITAVLDMQSKDVSKIMQPRVEIVALPSTALAIEILQTAVSTDYSRLPVYRGDVDHIVGVIFCKDLLDYMNLPADTTNALASPSTASAPSAPSAPYTPNGASTIGGGGGLSAQELVEFRPQMKENWGKLTALELMKPVYYIPETMSCWSALEEMRKRRVHMAVIVDEYGGTAGLVTFEDLLEEVVGEIYDEDDEEEAAQDGSTISRRADGVIEIRGYAELDDVLEALDLELEDNEKPDGEYSTIGGLLNAVAGRIPVVGDQIILKSSNSAADFVFTVQEVEDSRRVQLLTVQRIEHAKIALLDPDSDRDTRNPDSRDTDNRDRDRDKDRDRDPERDRDWEGELEAARDVEAQGEDCDSWDQMQMQGHGQGQGQGNGGRFEGFFPSDSGAGIESGTNTATSTSESSAMGPQPTGLEWAGDRERERGESAASAAAVAGMLDGTAGGGQREVVYTFRDGQWVEAYAQNPPSSPPFPSPAAPTPYAVAPPRQVAGQRGEEERKEGEEVGEESRGEREVSETETETEIERSRLLKEGDEGKGAREDRAS